METFEITGEYIQLNQLIKAIGWCENGAEANRLIEQGKIKVNGEPESRKRNKIYPGMVVQFNAKKVTVE